MFFGVMVLLLVLSLTACACANEIERLINELIAQLIEDIEQAARDWWQNLVEDLKQQIADWWEGVKRDMAQEWQDLQDSLRDYWASIFPPAPTISAPADGTVASSKAISMRGAGLPGSTVTLWRGEDHYREATVNEAGEWQMDGVGLNKGDNTFKASVRMRWRSSPKSDPVHVAFRGGEMGAVPTMSPAIDPALEPHVWMVELVLEQLKAGSETFYEERRTAFTTALRAGLQASKEDDEAHRFINLDVPLTFDKYLLFFLAPKDAPTDQVLEAFSKAVESAVLDEAVRQELMLQVTESLERMELTWVVEEGGETFAFEYVRIELDRTYLLEYFDPRALAKFRARLGTELVTGLLSEAGGGLVEKVVQMGFALWGQADADSQTQHYYELAVRAWNHRDIDGTPLRWDDPANNAFDGDMGYTFASNEEWAMFYLGRAAFYIQSPADPYYTIPYYKPEADLYAFLARKSASELIKNLIQGKVTAAFGRVIGGARPITAIFTTAEILDWMTNFLRYLDAREVRDVHRPNFAEFTAGAHFDYPMPEERRQVGAINEQAGYPFRGPNDFMLYEYLQTSPLSVQERGEYPILEFAIESLLESRSQELATDSWSTHDLRWLVRDLGQRATQYVHAGKPGQTDQRVPEGNMIVGNPYLIREIFSYEFTGMPPDVWWRAELGSHLRLVLLDGTVIEVRVDNRPAFQPMNYRYHNSQTLIENEVWVYVISLNELSYIAGTMDSFPYNSLDLIAVEGAEQHLYAVFDRCGGSPAEIAPCSWPDLMYYLIGVAGNKALASDLPEKDGAAHIVADRLAVGTLSTRHLLDRFAAEAPAYQPPEPIVVGSGDLGVALGSPAQLHLYDRHGRHVGPNLGGDRDLNIPGAHYFTNPETGQQFIVIPHADLDDQYTVQVEGIGDGAFDLDVFYTDRRLRQDVRLAYENVPLSSDTNAELAVRADDTHTLHVDDDGDGTFDQEMSPSRTIRVDVLELDQALGAPSPLVIGALLLTLCGVGLLLTLRRWRQRRQPALVPVSQALPTCARCGTTVRPGARFCSLCGGPLSITPPALPVCPRCGATAHRPGARFCPRCGGPLTPS